MKEVMYFNTPFCRNQETRNKLENKGGDLLLNDF